MERFGGPSTTYELAFTPAHYATRLPTIDFKPAK